MNYGHVIRLSFQLRTCVSQYIYIYTISPRFATIAHSRACIYLPRQALCKRLQCHPGTPRIAIAAQKRTGRAPTVFSRNRISVISLACVGKLTGESTRLDVLRVKMAKPGFYAVARGRRTGVFKTWYVSFMLPSRYFQIQVTDSLTC